MTDIAESVVSVELLPDVVARPLRILFFAWNYYPSPTGGAERQARLQAEELTRRGHEVTVVCPRWPGTESAAIGGVAVRRLYRSRLRGLGRITYLFSIVGFLLREGRMYDLMHVHLANVQTDVIVPIAMVLRRPVYAKLACGGEAGEFRRLQRVARLTRWFGIRHATRVQALSSEIAVELDHIGVDPRRVVRLANGLDLDSFSPASVEVRLQLRRELDLPHHETLVLFVGRFAEYKGISDLLAVWQTVHGGGATLVLVGTADTDRPIEGRLSGERVIVRDFTNEVVRYMKACDVFVYPSHADGMSNAVLEALSCGMACVVSTSGATAEIVTDGVDALLFEPRDRGALAEKLSKVLADEVLRRCLQDAARDTATEFDIRGVVDRLEIEYRTMVRGQ